VKLSDGEKLLAVMLADLMEAQGVNREIDPAFVKTAIFGGDLWSFKWQYSGLFEVEEAAPEAVKETADILSMCSFVEYSIKELAAAELELIPGLDRIVFEGFDGNHDEHYGVASMFITTMGRWSEFRDHPLNSHSMVLPKYRRMLAVYEGLAKRHGGFNLSEIQAILGA
jgi:hypothetical protein